jgi:predicted Zn-dependent protease
VRLRPVLRFGLALTLIASLALALQPRALAARGISLIRDAEIEADLRRMTAPILEAAGLGVDSINLYIVNDDRLNAFVAGGMNLFLNTGFIMRTEHVGQLVGVMAHEIGHISGGHLSRVGAAQRQAAAEMILAAVLGAAAAVAGAPQLGTAIITGGQSYAQTNFMTFTRSQEQAADQAALTYLDRAGLSARGLAEFFKVLETQNVLAVSAPNPYLRSHPLTRERMQFVEGHLQRQEADASTVPEGWELAHSRMVAKLRAFLNDPRQVIDRYAQGDGLVERYARAIAYYRLPDLPRALGEIDGLLADYPDDPYFHELKGQMLFENGRVEAAVGPYREAVRLQPTSALLRIGLAQALIETGAPDANQDAIGYLEEAIHHERTNPTAWRLLGIAQGRNGLEGRSALSFAEYALLIGKQDDARLYAKRAEARIEPSDPAWLRLQDILRVIEQG